MSVTRASNLFRRELCAGSALAEAELAPIVDEDSEDSIEGTMLHNLAANPGLDRSALNAEQLDVLRCAADADEQIFRLIADAKRISEDEPYEEGHEKELWMARGIKRIFSGHCDRWRYYPRLKFLVIIDYKFGRREVAAAEANVQLRAYAVMGAREFDADHVFVAINQPRLSYNKRVTVGEYLRDTTLPAAREHLLRIWDGSHDTKGQPRSDVPREAGEDQCRYCEAKVSCDAYRAKYVALADQSRGGKDIFVGRLSAASDMQLDEMWRAVAFAKVVEDALKTEILRRKEEGGMEMYELKPTGDTSKITDPARARAALKRLGFTDAELDARAKYSFSSLEDLYRMNHGCSAKAAKEAVRGALEAVLEVTPKSPSLVRVKGYVPRLEAA